jgi:hypothetical protein
MRLIAAPGAKRYLGAKDATREEKNMLQLILMTATLTQAPAVPAAVTIQGPCTWPRVCSTQAVQEVAQVQTCVWPHTCAETPAQQVQTCVWPHKCA